MPTFTRASLSRRVPALRALALAGLCTVLFLAAGCGRNRPEAVSSAVSAALAKLQARQPREGLSMLLGRPVDEATLQRAGQTLLHLRNRAAVHDAEQCAANLVALADAVEMYRADDEVRRELPEKLPDLVRGHYLKAIPSCPAANADSYSAGYHCSRGGDTYRLVCSGEHHAAAGLRAGHPLLDPRWGLQVDHDAPLAWWPTAYEASVTSVEVQGGTAKAHVHEKAAWAESQPTETDFILTLQKRAADGSWTVGDGSSDSALLGAVVTTYLQAEAHGPSAVASREECQRTLQRLATALEMWSSDHDGRYPERLTELVPRYVRALPTCPHQRPSSVPHYSRSSDGDNFDLSCGGEHPDVHVSSRAGQSRGVDSHTIGTATDELGSGR